jgi:hypothetical protein
VIDVSETLHSQRERGRVHAQGRRTDDNSHHMLLIINESDRSWVIHVPGVRLSQPVMVAVAESILVRAR